MLDRHIVPRLSSFSNSNYVTTIRWSNVNLKSFKTLRTRKITTNFSKHFICITYKCKESFTIHTHHMTILNSTDNFVGLNSHKIASCSKYLVVTVRAVVIATISYLILTENDLNLFELLACLRFVPLID